MRTKEVFILGNPSIVDTSVGSKRLWFNVKGTNQIYKVWVEVIENKIVDSSCPCYWESNQRFGNSKKCKHLVGCEMIVSKLLNRNI